MTDEGTPTCPECDSEEWHITDCPGSEFEDWEKECRDCGHEWGGIDGGVAEHFREEARTAEWRLETNHIETEKAYNQGYAAAMRRAAKIVEKQAKSEVVQ